MVRKASEQVAKVASSMVRLPFRIVWLSSIAFVFEFVSTEPFPLYHLEL